MFCCFAADPNKAKPAPSPRYDYHGPPKPTIFRGFKVSKAGFLGGQNLYFSMVLAGHGIEICFVKTRVFRASGGPNSSGGHFSSVREPKGG